MNAARSVWASGWARTLAALATLACALAAATSYGADRGGGVLKVRMAGDASETRVVVELDRSARAKLVSEAGERRRLVLAWPGLDAGEGLSGRGRGLVQAWAVEEAAGAARLKLELAEDAEIARRFLLPPGDGVKVYRYVVDLKRAAAPKRAAKSAAEPPRTVTAPRRVSDKRVVVIDAGHGGKDPGAIGRHGKESSVTMAAARALKARLERSGRYKVVLTREKDVFLPLETRVRIARQADADLFISLHADAGAEPSLRGASVYTLSENGSDRVAERVMARDGSLGGFRMAGSDRAVNQILLDLTQRATRNQSATFAQLMLAELGEVSVLLRRSHRDAGFVVLLAPDVPAVLLEMGFLTNAHDDVILNDPKRRKAMMEAVGDSIDAYFAREARYAADPGGAIGPRTAR